MRRVEVRAEMEANVWKVTCEAGQRIAAGDEVVILESMKMEIPVESPVGGTIAEVRAQPGEAVKEGQVLLVVSVG